MSLNEMLSKGLGIIGDSYDICLFMPQNNDNINKSSGNDNRK